MIGRTRQDRVGRCVIDIGGVRESLESYDEDPGWYAHSEGTMATAIGRAELRAAGIRI